MKTKFQQFKLHHRCFNNSETRTDLGTVYLDAGKLTLDLSDAGRGWFGAIGEGAVPEARAIIRRLAEHADTFGIWDEASGLGLEVA